MRKNYLYRSIVLVVLIGIVSGVPLFAQDGKVKMKVHPPQAYVFVDGQAMGQAYHTLALSPGNHRIDLYNYGYKPLSRDVSISAGATTDLDANLETISDTVSGPWGCITIEGAQRDAILLNGKTPDYFVGHGDEFNHEWWWKQELVVPPGTHQLTVVKQGKEIWSGPVEVLANQRVVVDIPKGVRKSVPWPRGEKLASLPRFKAGTASALVAVAKPTAQLSTQTSQINCGDSSLLRWSSSDAPNVEISNIGAVGASGEQSVQIKQPTTYELKASGPGGTATSSTTVNVNNAIQAQLGLSQPEVHFKRVGDKVVEEGITTLNWSASNANAASIDPFGSVDLSGNRSLQVVPRKTDAGAVDETVTYTLTASNACGAMETRIATLHILGSIEPEVVAELAMRSIYFPTDLPRTSKAQAGLLQSQRQTLMTLAEAFKKYLASKPGARLTLVGHADERGSKDYNQALSERRAQLAKSFLTSQGVPADNIEAQGVGEAQNLNSGEVKQSVQQNPDLREEARALLGMPSVVLAHNRRVDISLSTTGQQSVRNYPFSAEDYSVLVKRGEETKSLIVPAALKEKTEN